MYNVCNVYSCHDSIDTIGKRECSSSTVGTNACLRCKKCQFVITQLSAKLVGRQLLLNASGSRSPLSDECIDTKGSDVCTTWRLEVSTRFAAANTGMCTRTNPDISHLRRGQRRLPFGQGIGSLSGALFCHPPHCSIPSRC